MVTENSEWVEDPSLPNNGPTVNTAVWCLFSVATIFLALRVYCKFIRHRGLWWDDNVLIASWISFLVAAAYLSVNISKGFGKPGINIDPKNSYDIGLGGMVVGTMVLIAPVLSKASFILTISKISGPKLKIALWFIIVSMVILQVAAIIIQWVQCTPVEKVWNPFAEGECWGRETNLGMSMSSSAYSGIMDLVLATIPWIVLKDLQIQKREKIGIALAMSLGVIAAVTAFIKCAKQKLLASSDFTLEGGELIIWASTEISATIIAASVPVLRTLAREISTSRSRGRGGGGYFRSGSGTNEYMSRGARHNTNVVSVSARDKNTANAVSTDAGSDKSILEGAGHGKILKTEEIAVRFANREDGTSLDYEMHDLKPGKRHQGFD